MAVDCKYPDCLKCDLPECDMNDKDIAAMLKRRRWNANRAASQQKQRDYREQKRINDGLKTMQEIQTEKQNMIYQFIVKYVKEHLYPPSTVEIQNEFGMKANSCVTRDLHRLEERGLIKIGKGNRTYTLVGYEIVKKGES